MVPQKEYIYIWSNHKFQCAFKMYICMQTVMAHFIAKITVTIMFIIARVTMIIFIDMTDTPSLSACDIYICIYVCTQRRRYEGDIAFTRAAAAQRRTRKWTHEIRAEQHKQIYKNMCIYIFIHLHALYFQPEMS